MPPNARTSQKVVAGRPAYMVIGRDETGASHVYRTTDETIHVVRDTEREHVQHLGARPVEDWLAHVADARGWAETHFALGLEDFVGGAFATEV